MPLGKGSNLFASTSPTDTTAGVNLTDEKGLALSVKSALGGATPPTTTDTYAKGCVYIDTTQTNGTTPFWINIGSSSSVSWSQGGAGDITSVTAGAGLTGGGSSGAVTLTPGLTVQNATGGTINFGDLVAVSGYDTTSGLPTIVKADADANIVATHVAPASISSGASGTVQEYMSGVGFNTLGSSVGDPVYLSVTAGAFTLTAPALADNLVQQVGAVVSVAADGGIYFFPAAAKYRKFGTSNLQDTSVTVAKIGAITAGKFLVGNPSSVATAGVNPVTVTAVAGSVTSNLIASTVVSSSNNLGTATAEFIVVNNNIVTPSSVVLAGITATGIGGDVAVKNVVPSSGSFSVQVKNNSPVNPMTSTYSFSYLVIN